MKHIGENPYLQYFIGMKEYGWCPFRTSTLVAFRKRFRENDLAAILEASVPKAETEKKMIWMTETIRPTVGHWSWTPLTALRTSPIPRTLICSIRRGRKQRSGFELCRELREITENPILFISARISDNNQIIALSIGGDDYIQNLITPLQKGQFCKSISSK